MPPRVGMFQWGIYSTATRYLPDCDKNNKGEYLPEHPNTKGGYVFGGVHTQSLPGTYLITTETTKLGTRVPKHKW